MCNHTIICHCDCPPAVRIAEGLADNHCDLSLAVPRDCPRYVDCSCFLSISHLCILRIMDPSSCILTCTCMASTVKRALTVVWWICRFFALFSQMKKIRVWVANPDVQIACYPNELQSAACFPKPTTVTAPCGLRITQMSGQFSLSWWERGCPLSRKIAELGGLWKICAVWTVCQSGEVTSS